MAAVRDIAADTPQSFEEVAEAAIRLRKQGFDPLDGTLQALIDNNAALDGSQQDLIQTIDTLGKAQLRGQLNMRAFVALQQQGIPCRRTAGQGDGGSPRRRCAGSRPVASSGRMLSRCWCRKSASSVPVPPQTKPATWTHSSPSCATRFKASPMTWRRAARSTLPASKWPTSTKRCDVSRPRPNSPS
jgi:hypothetical protein